MNRMRRLLLVAGAGLTVVALTLILATSVTIPPVSKAPAARAAAGAAEPRPNIVLILTDDLSMNLLPYLPAVREMQRQGTTLSHYYVVDSLCCPSRTAIFTGEYPHNNGVFTNSGHDGGYAAYNAHGDEHRSFAVALQKAGYRTGFMGKYLNGYQASDPRPPGWDTWAAVGNGYHEFNYDMNADGRVQHFGHEPQDYLTDVLSRRAGAFIDSSVASARPFMLEVATFAPHSPYTPAPRYAHAYADLTYPRTPAFGRLPQHAPPWLAGRPALTRRQQGTLDAVFRQRVRAGLAVNDLVDHVKSVLRATGAASDTYLIFSSDNGYHIGEYRLLPGKQTAFDTDVHVPMVVTGPGVPAGHLADQLASNIDLAPTFETLAGAPVPVTVDGVSLSPLWHGRSPALWQQAVLVEHHHPVRSATDPDRQTRRSGMPPTYGAVRTADNLYVRYLDGSQELIQTALDPYELNNLAAGGVPSTLETALTALEKCHGAVQCQAAAQLPSSVAG